MKKVLIRKHKIKDDDHNTGTDRYLLTYADLITLLLGLFIILFAISHLDTEKYKEMSKAMTQYFKSGQGVLEGGEGVTQGGKNALPELIPSETRNERSIEEIQRETEKSLQSYIDNGVVSIERHGSGLTLTFSEKLLFNSGSAVIRSGGITALDTLSDVLYGINKQITVDGHTDSDPISTFRYESNWHLSVARALNVAYTLMEKGVPEANMSIRGFGAQRPVADNDTEEGKALNRRVEISINDLPLNAPTKQGYTGGESKNEES